MAALYNRPNADHRPPNAVAWAHALVPGSVGFWRVVQRTPAAPRDLAGGRYPARRVRTAALARRRITPVVQGRARCALDVQIDGSPRLRAPRTGRSGCGGGGAP